MALKFLDVTSAFKVRRRRKTVEGGSGETSTRCIFHFLSGIQKFSKVSLNRLLLSYFLRGGQREGGSGEGAQFGHMGIPRCKGA